MTRHLHLDAVGGCAGDMFVASMLDAFPRLLDSCLNDLADSGILGHVAVTLTPGKSHGLAVQRFEVKIIDAQPRPTGTYHEIRTWLDECDLSEPVKHRAQRIMLLLAEAESHVHGVAIDEVHFHEVADWDSLTDVVAAASVIEHSGVESFSCSKLPLGSGLVDTEHGRIPVPAPATVNLMQGMQVWDDGESGERVTPTGAAIVRYLLLGTSEKLVHISTKPSGTFQGVGVGAGQRVLQCCPNILRSILIETDTASQYEQNITDEVDELRFAIDDMTPEELAISLGYIRAADGVVDASFTVGVGKKERVVFDVCVLCVPAFEESVSRVCFAQTSTLGMRSQRIRRRILKRELYTVGDELGSATIKQVQRADSFTAKVESDDLQHVPTLAERRSRAAQLLALERS